jgi:pimeloyl-ACP methyl ester carboxylesterase
MKHFLFGLLLVGIFSPVSLLHAQTPCGNIIAPADFYYEGSEAEITPIENCANPFERTHPLTTLRIDGVVATEGTTYEVDADGLETYGFTSDTFYNTDGATYYRKEGADYVHVKTEFAEPTHEAIAASITAFFGGTSAREMRYREAYFSADTYDFFQSSEGELYIDGVTGTYVYEVYEEMENYMQSHVQSPRTPLLPGTYTVIRVDTDEGPTPTLNTDNLFKQFFATLIPTAHAYYNVETVTFTLSVPEEPTGASSVLFLPGIQGSRLYMDSNGMEEQLWEPFGTEDYEKLRMTDAALSVNDVYTRDVVDQIYGVGGGVYKTFIEFLRDIDGPLSGPLVETFPYDWRQDVFDIVEKGTRLESGRYAKPTTTVAFLASTSPTEKVTIIAHSNGGLLAKALMLKLAEEGMAGLVDKVIFIATPHIGTPKAVAALLHGYDQEVAFNIPADARDIRKVLKNMPGAYGLLPSESYLTTLTEPIISFDGSTTTKQFRDRYGFTINNMSEYRDFLSGAEGRTEVWDTIALPTKANATMLEDSLLKHANALDTWEAPSGVEVFNIVGTGLVTPKAITYQSFDTSVCPVEVPSCLKNYKLEPVVEFTRYGDETVVTKSATGVGSDAQLYLNLSEENRGVTTNRKHSDITESNTLQHLISRILHASTTNNIAYITTTEPTLDTSPLIVEKIHSPARIYIEDMSGNRTGRDSASATWKEEIPDTNYFEIGGVKYIIKPKNLNHRVVIVGEGTGVFTHVIDVMSGEAQTTQHAFVESVMPSTRVTFTSTNGSSSVVSVDQNGDGVPEYQLTQDGERIEIKATYNELKITIRALHVSKLREVLLLGIAAQAEQFFKKRTDTRNSRFYEKLEEGALTVLDQSLIQMRKGRFISAEAYQRVKSVIDKLIKQ